MIQHFSIDIVSGVMRRLRPMTLLDRAKKTPEQKKPAAATPPELIELAVAWFKSDISDNQLTAALQVLAVSPARYRMATVLRNAIRDGRVRVEVVA